MLRLGIIGCGRVTSMFHLRAIEQLPDVSVTAVLDIDEARMREAQIESGAEKAYHIRDEFFQDLDIDAVAINTPPRFHEELALKALEHGMHVICEKPLAETIEGCKKIQEAQESTGLIVLPAHNYRFTPSLTLMEDYLARDSLGEITGIQVAFENNLKLYRSETDFRQNKENGVVEDVLPHILSVVQHLVGHINSVEYVDWWCKNYDVCDNMKTRFGTSTVSVDASLSWTTLRPKFVVSIDCENGSLCSDLMMNPYKLEVSMNGKQETISEKGISWYIDLIKFKHPSFKNQYHHFNQLITGKEPQRITVEDEINILETMKLVSDSMRIE
ncbi:MAG: Gfo/Idh/MocA family oxidoreductase [Candidatus Bathyarchaeota archaeon]|nr:Gfo/Idh/MocA family oxidoreductase [Candidatus Bathyarchaeota archaeon]